MLEFHVAQAGLSAENALKFLITLLFFLSAVIIALSHALTWFMQYWGSNPGPPFGHYQLSHIPGPRLSLLLSFSTSLTPPPPTSSWPLDGHWHLVPCRQSFLPPSRPACCLHPRGFARSPSVKVCVLMPWSSSYLTTACVFPIGSPTQPMGASTSPFTLLWASPRSRCSRHLPSPSSQCRQGSRPSRRSSQVA